MKKTVRPFMALNVRIAKSVSCFFAAGMQGSDSITDISKIEICLKFIWKNM